jgi:hypothetical protein
MTSSVLGRVGSSRVLSFHDFSNSAWQVWSGKSYPPPTQVVSMDGSDLLASDCVTEVQWKNRWTNRQISNTYRLWRDDTFQKLGSYKRRLIEAADSWLSIGCWQNVTHPTASNQREEMDYCIACQTSDNRGSFYRRSSKCSEPTYAPCDAS